MYIKTFAYRNAAAHDKISIKQLVAPGRNVADYLQKQAIRVIIRIQPQARKVG
ncbi:hypothetical protein [Mucilaginibacter ginkgonis]|uniref:Uncharacterized protein n=1 Tax=Mucilaginibacter ginkgonis TaxID=2682091 RepID=A0A7T7JHP6_9SPHI|nr:hypothetical protein [Mucilaginibacter ginkgonis]QQL50755.1 hypothetical protein GO620_004660 [Mucilaginibacter ginkgonis]